MALSADIRDKLSRDFPDENPERFVEILAGYRGPERNRVLRCILHVAQGDPDRLAHAARAAQVDYRDVIYWAEYDDQKERKVRDFSKPFPGRFRRNWLLTTEALIFVLPYWCLLLYAALGLVVGLAMQIDGEALFWSALLYVAHLIGALVLTRMMLRGFDNAASVSFIERLILILGLLACSAPLTYVMLQEPGLVRERILVALMALWPAPVYLHGLVRGFGRSEPELEEEPG